MIIFHSSIIDKYNFYGNSQTCTFFSASVYDYFSLFNKRQIQLPGNVYSLRRLRDCAIQSLPWSSLRFSFPSLWLSLLPLLLAWHAPSELNRCVSLKGNVNSQNMVEDVSHSKSVIAFGNPFDLFLEVIGTVTTPAQGVEDARSYMLDHVGEDRPWWIKIQFRC